MTTYEHGSHGGHEHGHGHADDREHRDDHGHGHHGHDHAALFDNPDAAAFLELEADVLIGFVDQALDAIAAIGADTAITGTGAVEDTWRPARIVDLGCGVGTASRRAADRFATATVVGVDGSAAMLDRARSRTGASVRLDWVQRNLDGDLVDLGPADLVWASMALHHVADEAGLVERMAAMLAESVAADHGGMLALVEFGDPLRIELPDGAAEGGISPLWARANDAFARWFADLRASLAGDGPDDGADAGPANHAEMVEAAGLEVVVDRLLTVELAPELTEDEARFVRGWVARSAERLAGYLADDDRAALRALANNDGGGGRDPWTDARLVASRRLLIARRPLAAEG